MKVNEQLSLLPVLNVDENISRIFKVVEKKAEDGSIKRQSITLPGRKDVAAALGLQPKKDGDKIDEEIINSSDKLKAEMVIAVSKIGQDAKFTGGNVVVTRSKNGGAVTFKFKSIERKNLITDDKLAECMFPAIQYPGMSHEEKLERIAAMRERQKAELAANTVEA